MSQVLLKSEIEAKKCTREKITFCLCVFDVSFFLVNSVKKSVDCLLWRASFTVENTHMAETYQEIKNTTCLILGYEILPPLIHDASFQLLSAWYNTCSTDPVGCMHYDASPNYSNTKSKKHEHVCRSTSKTLWFSYGICILATITRSETRNYETIIDRLQVR